MGHDFPKPQVPGPSPGGVTDGDLGIAEQRGPQIPVPIRRFKPWRQVARFWARVDKRGPKDCWPWQGTLNRDGYGRAWFDERDDQAHRVSFRLAGGVIEKGAVLRHSCDNRRCVNPAHLEPGTIAENNADMVGRGRHSFGAKTANAKLSDDDVRAIRQRFGAGETRYQLAERFHVTHRTISYIVRGERWKHLA